MILLEEDDCLKGVIMIVAWLVGIVLISLHGVFYCVVGTLVLCKLVTIGPVDPSSVLNDDLQSYHPKLTTLLP